MRDHIVIRDIRYFWWQGGFWRDAIGAGEGLWTYGHRLYMDTDVQVVTGSRPNYPFHLRSLTREDREAASEVH